MLCSATLELTQDNVDGGTLSSAVFARGEASDGQSVLGQDTVSQEIGQAVGLSLGARWGINWIEWLHIAARSRRSRVVRSAHDEAAGIVLLSSGADERDRHKRAGVSLSV